MTSPFLAGSGSAASGGSTTLTVPISNAIATGNSIQVGIAVTASSVIITSVTDTQGNTYGKISGATNTTQAGAQIWVYHVASAIGLTTSDVVTITYSASTSVLGAIVVGDPNVTALDSASSNSASNAGTSTIELVVPNTGTLTQAQENIIVFSVAGENTGTNSASYTTPGTHSYTPNAGVTAANVTVIAGGGGGGCGYIGSNYSGSGGGGGGSAYTAGLAVSSSNTYTATVGSGGAGGDSGYGANGSSGSLSSFALGGTTYLSATAGGGGSVAGYNSYGSGGGGTLGGSQFTGGNGGYSSASGPNADYGDYGGGGGGSGGSAGNGGNGTNGGTVGYSQRGQGGTAGAGGGAAGGEGGNAANGLYYTYMSGGNGVSPGGGGGGGGNNTGDTGVGGNGAHGAVTVQWATTGGVNTPTWGNVTGITSLTNVQCSNVVMLSAAYVQVNSTAQIEPEGTLTTSAAWAVGAVADEVTQVSSATILSNGIINIAYSQALVSTGGTGPYTYSLTGGSLPPGYSLTTSGGSAGTISGTDTSTSGGTYTFTIKISDNSTPPATGTYSGSITIIARTTQGITSAALPLPSNFLSLVDSDFETGIGTWIADSNATGVGQNE